VKTLHETLQEYKNEMQELKYFRWHETYDIRKKNVQYEIQKDIQMLDGLQFFVDSKRQKPVQLVHNLDLDRIKTYIKNPQNWEWSICDDVKSLTGNARNIEFEHCAFNGHGYELTFRQKQTEKE